MDPNSRVELKLERDRLDQRQEEMLESLGKVPLDNKSLHDFWRDYSMLGHKIEFINSRLKPTPTPHCQMRRDTAHEMIFRNGKEKASGS